MTNDEYLKMKEVYNVADASGTIMLHLSYVYSNAEFCGINGGKNGSGRRSEKGSGART
jgi:hypothetical protein